MEVGDRAELRKWCVEMALRHVGGTSDVAVVGAASCFERYVLRGLAAGELGDDAVPENPAVSAEESVGQDSVTCMNCGRSMLSLRRHLRSAHGLTPERYRTLWGLPSDHPIVAGSYSEKRSSMAKDMGLGKRIHR